MKIVVLDGYTLNPGDISWDGFERLGDLVCYDRTPEDRIDERIDDADVVITNKTPISRATIESRPNLRYIGLLATGYNVVDVHAAREKGITVTNVPTYGTAAVAQFVFALLLELCHRVGYHADTVRQGRWANSEDWCYWDYPLNELDGQTIGIIGFGRIGQRVADIAVAFGMNVLAYDETVRKELENDKVSYVGLDELLTRSDVISLHVPLFDSTKGMINTSSIARMKDGVIVINTSRGPLVVEEDIIQALTSGKVGGYGTDVVTVEPIPAGSPLPSTENCLVTPHIAWAPKAARKRLMAIASANLESFVKGTPVNVVNA